MKTSDYRGIVIRNRQGGTSARVLTIVSYALAFVAGGVGFAAGYNYGVAHAPLNPACSAADGASADDLREVIAPKKGRVEA